MRRLVRAGRVQVNQRKQKLDSDMYRTWHEPMLASMGMPKATLYYTCINITTGGSGPPAHFSIVKQSLESLTLRMIDLVSCVLTRAQTKRVLSKESEQSDYPLDAVLISTQVPVLRYMFCFDEVETCLRYEMGTYNISI